jgi:predicted  nucleic acid-binding Zn-ribbon protein
MNEELQTLWALNTLDERLVVLQSALARFPEQRRGAEQRLVADRGRLETLKKELTGYQTRRRQIEKDIEALQAEERKYQGQLPLVKKNEEYSALLHEIAGVKKKGSDRETDLLMLMDEEERRQAERPKLEKELATVEAEISGRLGALAAEEQAERDKAAVVEAERAKLLERLPAGTRSRYERIRASKGGRAVVPILKGACGGCFRAQPPQMLQEARRGDRLLTCEGCGRLLIWPPETGG